MISNYNDTKSIFILALELLLNGCGSSQLEAAMGAFPCIHLNVKMYVK